VKPRTAESAEKAVAEATDRVVAQGGVVHEEALYDAHEAALDGASPQVLVEYINGTRTQEYVPSSGWTVNAERN
jgi:uncharacterized protein YcnI